MTFRGVVDIAKMRWRIRPRDAADPAPMAKPEAGDLRHRRSCGACASSLRSGTRNCHGITIVHVVHDPD
jgi:hypothetical protein